MPLPTYPVLPAPRTWSPGDPLYTPRLRDDLLNAVTLLAYRPMYFGGQTVTGQALTSGAWNPVDLDTDNLDAWSGHTPPNPQYDGPLGGWYLTEGYTEATHIPATDNFAVAMRVTQNGTTTDTLCGCGPGNGTNDQGAGGACLAQLDPTTGDTCEMLAKPGASCHVVASTTFKAEWVAQPSTLAYGTGTVVTNPQPAALWPSGTMITDIGGIPAGATSVTVQSAAGIRVGGTLGLDYLHGVAVSPLAEIVTVTSVAGPVIGITATAYPHGGGYSPGAVGVPVGAAFLNEQIRDLINFLCYPPIASLAYTPGAATLASNSVPSGTPITFTSAAVDNFGAAGSGGWDNATRYFFPVGGEYYLYGHAATAAATAYSTAAGLAINGGTTQWGTTVRNPNGGTSLFLTATVRRAAVRVQAGDYVQLIGSQNSGSPLALESCSLIAVFRGF